MAAVKISSGRRKAARKFWAPQQSRLQFAVNIKKHHSAEWCFFVLALPIFPGRLQPSIVGRSELNFRVRDGNGWTLALISTNLSAQQCSVMPTHVQLLAP